MPNRSRGVAPIVAVMLMVAITTLTAAIAGTFMLDLTAQDGGDAKVSITQDSIDNEVKVYVETTGTYDYVTVEGPSKKTQAYGEQTITFTDVEDGDRILVIGTQTAEDGLYTSSDRREELVEDYTVDWL